MSAFGAISECVGLNSESHCHHGRVKDGSLSSRVSIIKVTTIVYFFDWRGLLYIDFLPKHRAITAEHYRKVLSGVCLAYRRKRRDLSVTNEIFSKKTLEPI